MVLLVSYPRFDVLALVMLPYMEALAWFYQCRIPCSTFLLLSCCLIWRLQRGSISVVSQVRRSCSCHVALYGGFGMVLLVSYPRFDVLALVMLPYMVALAWFYQCCIPGSTFLLLSCCLIWRLQRGSTSVISHVRRSCSCHVALYGGFSMVLLVSYPRFDVLALLCCLIWRLQRGSTSVISQVRRSCSCHVALYGGFSVVLLVSYPRFDILALVMLPYMVALAWFYQCRIPGSTFLLLSCCLIWWLQHGSISVVSHVRRSCSCHVALYGGFSMVLLVSYPRFDVLALLCCLIWRLQRGSTSVIKPPRFDVLALVLLPYMEALAWFYQCRIPGSTFLLLSCCLIWWLQHGSISVVSQVRRSCSCHVA